MRAIRLRATFLLVVGTARADQGILVVRIQDLLKRPLAGLQMRAEGGAVSSPSDRTGIARLHLDRNTAVGAMVGVSVVSRKDVWEFLSPPDARLAVPSFDKPNETPVTLVTPQELTMLTEIIINRVPPKIREDPAETSERSRLALEEVAHQYSVKAEDVDQAIRALGSKTEDPYTKGITALYEQRYPEATTNLQKSLYMREQEEKQAERKATENEEEVADAAFHLGQALYEEGRYAESAAAYEKCAERHPSNGVVLGNFGLSLAEAGDFDRAEPLLRRALAIEEALGLEHAMTATALNNLAELLREKGDYVGAEPLLRRALTIDERALGPENASTARDLNSLAVLRQGKGDYAGAEPLFRQALAIDEKALGPDHATTARVLNNLAALLEAKGDYGGAEPLYRRSLAILEKTLGEDHPLTQKARSHLESLLTQKRDRSNQ